jgi:hypothetical protein
MPTELEIEAGQLVVDVATLFNELQPDPIAELYALEAMLGSALAVLGLDVAGSVERIERHRRTARRIVQN